MMLSLLVFVGFHLGGLFFSEGRSTEVDSSMQVELVFACIRLLRSTRGTRSTPVESRPEISLSRAILRR